MMRRVSDLFLYLSWSLCMIMTSAIEYEVDSQCPNIDLMSSDEDKRMWQNIQKDFTRRKYDWEEITDIVSKGLNHNKRNAEETFTYRKCKQTKLRKWNTMESHLKHAILHCEYFTKKRGNSTIKFVNTTKSCNSYAVVTNAYPYHMDDDITDFIILSLKPLGISRIKELIQYRFPKDKHDIAIFEIPDKDKTVNISHVHFLVRPRKTSDYFVFVKDKKR